MSSREDHINKLKVIRQRMCAYAESEIRGCDCKYLSKEEKPGEVSFHFGFHGEQTGCCEMRDTITLLGEMTDLEYQTIISRHDLKTLQRMQDHFGKESVDESDSE